MTAAMMRRAERGIHLFWGLLIVLYVYGLLPSWGEPLVRWLVIPGIAASGFAMWFAAPLRKLLRRTAYPWITRPPRSRRGEARDLS